VSKIIQRVNSKDVVEGNRRTPRTGSFEVELDGKIIFSKFQLDRFPTEAEIKSWF
jgi:selT/selW/selH-like putative selenoprotein|tara:strand:- start:16 stop:180 length:165 start_codon:yes stop_codon:yes gene_type:complete